MFIMTGRSGNITNSIELIASVAVTRDGQCHLKESSKTTSIISSLNSNDDVIKLFVCTKLFTIELVSS